MPFRRFVSGAALLFAALTFVLPAAAKRYAGVEVEPPLPARPVFDTFFGTTVEDPYRFLEDTSDAEVQRWMRAQADATATILSRLPGRDALFARIREIDAAVPAVIGQIHRDDRGAVTYLKRGAQENQFKLYRRERTDREDRLLVDPDVIAQQTGKPHAIGGFSVSPDGRHVAYTISASGTEIGTLHVIDAATAKPVTPPIDRIRFGAMIWLDDASGFFYLRLADDYDKRPRAERFMDHRTYLRILAKPDADRVVFGPGVHPNIVLDRSDSTFVGPVPGRNVAFAVVTHGVQREESLYVSPLDAVLAGKPRWRKVYDASAGVQEITLAGRWLYVRSAKDAPRFKVLRMPVERPSLASATVVMPESDGVITDIGASRDALYVTRREGVEKKLYRISHDTNATRTPIALPVTGNVRIVNAHARASGAVLALGGWTRATRHYALDERGRARDLGLAPIGPFDAPDILVAREVRVKSHDGVEVPVSIIHAKDAKLDGSHPLIVYGYGAYGSVEEPGLSPRLVAWVERGGVFAIAHVRGGGVFGDAWRRAGWKATKPNTWKDGIAVAEWLIGNGYTGRERIAVYGGSAGGIFVGRAITERPELFKAAVIAVGNVDSIRSETRANGAANVPEYGTVAKEDEFRALLAMSPYANVKPDTAYPAVLFEHGVNDSRVDVWMSLKLASRLAAATTSDAPILLRLDYEGGHGVGATREQAQRQVADRWSFLLWQAGVPEFQPAP